jgi:hypothetical protein
LAEEPINQDLISDRGKTLFLLQNDQTGSGAHQASGSTCSGAFPPDVKRPGREADHSPPSSAEVKNEWSYTSTSGTPTWRAEEQLYFYV